MKYVKLIKENQTVRKLVSNFSYLSLIEIINLLLPLVSYPYLIRVVGADKYGIVVFAQAIISYLIIIINFGFNVSATRRVSENRNDNHKLNIIYSSVIYQKIILFFLSILILLPLLLLINYEHLMIIFGLMGLCLQEVFYPTWLYQGLENMKFITIITFISKCSYFLLIFIFIHNSADYVIVPYLYSISGIVTSILSLLIVKQKFNINFIYVSFSQIKKDFFESLPFFASRVSAVVMERTNVIAIGAFFSYEMVAIYDLCTKVVSIIKTPFSLVAQVIYPNVARNKNMNLIKKITMPLLLCGLLISFVVVILSKYIVLILGGEKMTDSIIILQLMVWYVPIVGISYLYGASVLVVMNHSKDYNMSVVYSVILYLSMIGCLILSNKINLFTMTFAYIVPELFVASYRVYITKKYKLLTK